jgi:hypothetical protein
VRFARDCGDLSILYPEGIQRLHDLPYTVFDAIKLALVWLGYEELESVDRPPREIWLDNDEMAKWWKAVKRRHRARWGDKSDVDEEIEGPTQRNALTDELLTR